jgi:cyclic pyranopterin monophosphate synthase
VELTHVDAAGAARMVDVTGKEATARTAVATGRLRTTAEVVDLLRRDGLPKGDALAIRIQATVRTTDRTGVEMEALTAVAVAGLTLHDMVKAVDPAAVLDAVRVERKEGGKTGSWTRPEDRP